jgi:hypothetical protein
MFVRTQEGLLLSPKETDVIEGQVRVHCATTALYDKAFERDRWFVLPLPPPDLCAPPVDDQPRYRPIRVRVTMQRETLYDGSALIVWRIAAVERYT